MKNKVDYSKYECPYSYLEKEIGHQLQGPEGYQDVYSVWCTCGFRAPVFYLEPDKIGLKLKKTKHEKINYKGKGEHSVNELELIIEQQAEELHWLKSGQKQLIKVGVGNQLPIGDVKILLIALEHIGKWGEEEEESWDDPGDCAMDAIVQYRYSIKNK